MHSSKDMIKDFYNSSIDHSPILETPHMYSNRRMDKMNKYISYKEHSTAIQYNFCSYMQQW